MDSEVSSFNNTSILYSSDGRYAGCVATVLEESKFFSVTYDSY